MRYSIGLILLLLGVGLQAQVFLPGKLYTTDGDTLVGLVAESGGITWSFKESKNAAEHIYTRRQILGFERRDERYEEHEIEVLRGKFPERVKDFLLVVEDAEGTGQVRLLRYDGKGIFGSDHTCYYLHEKGMAIPLRVNVDPGNFKTQMRQYFGDHPELAERIKSKELGYDNIQEIVIIYNAWYNEQPHTDEFHPEEASTESKAPKEKKPKKEKPDKLESEEDSIE
jgi:hypothetical protein